MRLSRVAVPMLLLVTTLLAACSSKATEKATDRVQRDIQCASYKIDRQGYSMVDGLPVVNGISARRVTEDCKLEIVAMHDYFPPGFPENEKPSRPTLTGLPPHVVDQMWIDKWFEIEKETPLAHQYIAVPAYTFQCWINEDNDSSYTCGAKVAASHRLSTYTEEGFEISGDGVIPLEVTNLKFSGAYGVSETETQLVEHGREVVFDLTAEFPAVWTALLVLHKEWERIGIARVCLEAGAVHCDVVRARVIHSEDYVLRQQTQDWNLMIARFREIIGKSGSLVSYQPSVPFSSLHSDYEGGPMELLLGGPGKQATATWKNSDSSLQKKNLKGSITIGLTLGISKGSGTENLEDSTAEISYPPEPETFPVSRCFEVKSVGGKAEDKPVTGMILKEGCSK